MRQTIYYILFIIAIGLGFNSCNEDETFTTSSGALLSFEMDTVRFDTVITTIGSSTKRFKVFNRNKDGLRIQSVRLESDGSSGFRINVDGHSGTNLTNLQILRKDSIFIFAEVTLNPQGTDKPTLVRDKIYFTLENGITQQIVLEAMGQDAIIMHSPTITSDTEWAEQKPYIVYDSLIVNEGATLTLKEGVNLYFHSGSYVGVHGQLICEGSHEKPIVFRGDRTDKMFSYLPYDRLDAQWGGIILYPESKNNLFDYVDIHGGNYGIDCPLSTVDEYKFFIQNSSIHNVDGYGLRAYYCIGQVLNSCITNAGHHCVSLIGGAYNFVHTTIVQTHPDGTDGVALFFSNTDDDVIYPLEQCNFYNCLITGYQMDEIQGNRIDREDIPFNATFDGCLVNIDIREDDPQYVKVMFANSHNEIDGHRDWEKTSDGEYKEEYIWGRSNFIKIDGYYRVYDFGLTEGSHARGIGEDKYTKYCPKDLNGHTRSIEHPDAGCYQYLYE